MDDETPGAARSALSYPPRALYHFEDGLELGGSVPLRADHLLFLLVDNGGLAATPDVHGLPVLGRVVGKSRRFLNHLPELVNGFAVNVVA